MNKQQVTISSLLFLIFILATFLTLNFAKDKLKLEATLLENDENFKTQSNLEYIIFDSEYKIIEQFSPNLGNLNEIYRNLKFEKINFKQNKKTKKFEFFYITKNNGLIIIVYKSFFEIFNKWIFCIYFLLFITALLFLKFSRKKNENMKEIILKNIFENSFEAIFLTDKNGFIKNVNDVFLKTTGYQKDQILGSKYILFNETRSSKSAEKEMNSDLLKKGFWSGEINIINKYREKIPTILKVKFLKNQNLYLGMFFETSAFKEKQDHLEQMALYDQLTNLPNKFYFERLLVKAIKDTQKAYKKSLAVLFIDFDGFKNINDTYGHKVGDIFLQKAADEMKTAIKDGDVLARFGGDEFGVIVKNLKDEKEIIFDIKRLLRQTSLKFKIGNHDIKTSISIGVSFYPQDGEIGFIELIRQADSAMYVAKKDKFLKYHIYSSNSVV